MGSKHFENQARREWWSLHIEAWQRSGLSRRRYCRSHRLSADVFRRWVRLLVDDRAVRAKAELEREKRLEKRIRKGKRLSSGTRSKAVQAFWAMHVEALNWSGMTVTHYALALGISVYSLRRWCELFETEEVSIDWRSLLHPSARPPLSTGVSTGANELTLEQPLTIAPSAGAMLDRRSNRRHFTDEQKLAIVMETEAIDATVAGVARRHDIVTSMIFRWRVQFGFGKETPAKLATVRLAGKEKIGAAGAHGSAVLLPDLLPVPDGMAAIDLPDGRRVFAPLGADPEAVRRHVAAQEAAP